MYKLGVMIGITELELQFNSSLLNLIFIQGHRGARKQKNKQTTSAPGISQSSQSVWVEFGVLLRLVGLVKYILILSLLISMERKKKPLLL